MQAINFQNQFRPQPQQNGVNPDDYAQKYATQNNMSLDDAKAELSSKYGAPEAQPSIFEGMGQNNNRMPLPNIDFSDIEGSDNNQNSLKNLFQKLLDFLKGGNGPQKEGDPQINGQNQQIGDGPQKEGDPQPHLESENGTEGPQKEGDPQPHLKGSESANGLPQRQDPDAYAQSYADEKGITLEEAKAELKAKYGDPEQR